MKNHHKVKFDNLIDSKTGKPLELEVPNDLIYEGKMFLAGTLGEQEGCRTLACLRSPDPDVLF